MWHHKIICSVYDRLAGMTIKMLMCPYDNWYSHTVSESGQFGAMAPLKLF